MNRKTTVNVTYPVYTELICSVTDAESVLNNLCDRELLVGGTIIQEATIDKPCRTGAHIKVGVYINKTTCRFNRCIEKRPCMNLSRTDDSSVSRIRLYTI